MKIFDTLDEYLTFISPDSNIKVIYDKELFTGCAGELDSAGCDNIPKEDLYKYSVLGTKFGDGILSIYVAR